MPVAGSAPRRAAINSNASTGRSLERPHLLVGALFFVVALVYLASPNVENSDSWQYFPTAVAVVHQGTVHLDAFQGTPAERHYGWTRLPDGHAVDYFPWAGGLFLVPTVLLIDGAHAIGVGPGATALVRTDRTDKSQRVTAALFTALAVVLVALVVWERVIGDHRRRLVTTGIVAAGFAFGTAAWSTASRSMWSQTPTIVLLSGALLLVQRLARTERANPAAAAALGALCAAAVAVRPTSAVLVGVLFVWTFAVLAHRGREWIPLLAGGAVVGGAWLVGNVAAYGSVLPAYTDSSRLGLSHTTAEALAANLVSPARGLLVFSPIVVLGVVGLFGRVRAGVVRGDLVTLDRWLMVGVVGHLLVVSSLKTTWWAGHTFGPRFMLEPLVPLAALAAPAVARLVGLPDGAATGRTTWRAAAVLTLVLAAWSVFVNAEGAWSGAALCWNNRPEIDGDPGRVWSGAHPQVLAVLLPTPGCRKP